MSARDWPLLKTSTFVDVPTVLTATLLRNTYPEALDCAFSYSNEYHGHKGPTQYRVLDGEVSRSSARGGWSFEQSLPRVRPREKMVQGDIPEVSHTSHSIKRGPKTDLLGLKPNFSIQEGGITALFLGQHFTRQITFGISA